MKKKAHVKFFDHRVGQMSNNTLLFSGSYHMSSGIAEQKQKEKGVGL